MPRQVANDIRFEKDDDNDIRIKALDYLFPKGHEVWVKVTSVEPDDRSGELRVNGSMKAVSQEDGSDLDPTGKLTAGGSPFDSCGWCWWEGHGRWVAIAMAITRSYQEADGFGVAIPGGWEIHGRWVANI